MLGARADRIQNWSVKLGSWDHMSPFLKLPLQKILFASNETLVKAVALKVYELKLSKEKNRADIAKYNVSLSFHLTLNA